MSPLPLTYVQLVYMHPLYTYTPCIHTPSYTFTTQALLRGASLPFVYDKARGTRFGVLPRTATDASAVQWLRCDAGMMILHVANAYQVGAHVIKLFAVVYDEVWCGCVMYVCVLSIVLLCDVLTHMHHKHTHCSHTPTRSFPRLLSP